MAKKKKSNPSYFKALIGEEAASKIGHYDVGTGGGTPLKKGEKLKDHPEAKRVLQPRDEDGQFTYNSANAIPLEHPSRGKTIPPFLKGVEINFAEKKKGMGVISNYNGKIYLSKIKMNEAEFVETCKYYIEEIGGFKGLTKEAETKKGRRSKEEKKYLNEKTEGIINGMKIESVYFTAFLNEQNKKLKSLKGKLHYDKPVEGKTNISSKTSGKISSKKVSSKLAETENKEVKPQPKSSVIKEEKNISETPKQEVKEEVKEEVKQEPKEEAKKESTLDSIKKGLSSLFSNFKKK